jgi:glutamine amidotransferase
MCRHLVYLGPPVPLARLLFEPSHSLERQSWRPREMRGGGTINADGFGVGWYREGVAAPLRYRRGTPLWTDVTLPPLAAVTSSGAVLAAVRSATVGMPVTEQAAAPFADGAWLFSHNGVLRGWPDSVGPLAAGLPVRDLLTLEAATDSALLWALIRHRLRDGVPAARAVSEVIRAVLAAAPESTVNVLLTDGRTAVATTRGHTLSILSTEDSVLISSEPLDDDPRWRGVDEGSLVTANHHGVRITPLSKGDDS